MLPHMASHPKLSNCGYLRLDVIHHNSCQLVLHEILVKTWASKWQPSKLWSPRVGTARSSYRQSNFLKFSLSCIGHVGASAEALCRENLKKFGRTYGCDVRTVVTYLCTVVMVVTYVMYQLWQIWAVPTSFVCLLHVVCLFCELLLVSLHLILDILQTRFHIGLDIGLPLRWHRSS